MCGEPKSLQFNGVGYNFHQGSTWHLEYREPMESNADLILQSALRLPELERLEIANRLMDSLPDLPGLALDDPELLQELERRAGDLDGAVPLADLWKED